MNVIASEARQSQTYDWRTTLRLQKIDVGPVDELAGGDPELGHEFASDYFALRQVLLWLQDHLQFDELAETLDLVLHYSSSEG